jgi:TetR/AcrR family transcriptional regulator
MSHSDLPKSTRDPERTRAAILAAAETLFAQNGFDATSLQEIGQRAGVSRGAPNYVFGTKERLYQAVLEHVLHAEHDSVAQVQARLSATEASSETLLSEVIRAHIQFLITRPSFVQLMMREALQGGRELHATQAYLAILQAGLDMVAAEQQRGAMRPLDPAQVLLSILALCWFPFMQAETIVRGLQLDVHDPVFLEHYIQHITELLVYGLQAR